MESFAVCAVHKLGKLHLSLNPVVIEWRIPFEGICWIMSGLREVKHLGENMRIIWACWCKWQAGLLFITVVPVETWPVSNERWKTEEEGPLRAEIRRGRSTMPELITGREMGDGSRVGGRERETSSGFAHMCACQSIPTACECDSIQIRTGYAYLHGYIWCPIRSRWDLIGMKASYNMCAPWSIRKNVGAMSTHTPSDSISKAVNSSIMQKVYSLRKHRRDPALLIMLLSPYMFDRIHKRSIVFIVHKIHVKVFWTVQCRMWQYGGTASNSECSSVFLWVCSVLLGFLLFPPTSQKTCQQVDWLG